MAQAQPSSGLISGTAKDEAKKPYTDYSVRARDLQQGQIAATTPLDTEGAFSLGNLSTAKYLVELLNKDGKVVCTEGPYDLASLPNQMKPGVVIDCNKVPVAWWLVGIATAAGITAGVTTTKDPETPGTPTQQQTPASPAQ
jgi:hypothetical protein